MPLDFQPGSLWRYSGGAGFDVLSRVVEVASGQTYDGSSGAAAGPLGMPDTGFFAPANKSSRVVTMSESTPNGLRSVARTDSTVYFSGAGGMMSTAEDYLQFAQMMLNGGELNGRRYLSPQTMALMTSTYRRHGERSVRPAGARHGIWAEHADRDGSGRSGLRVSKGAYGWAGGTGVSFWVEPAEQLVSIYSFRVARAASCAATSRTPSGRQSSIEGLASHPTPAAEIEKVAMLLGVSEPRCVVLRF